MSTPATFKEIVRAFECFGNKGQPVIEEILEHLRSYLVLSVWLNTTEIEVEFDRTPFETLLELQDMLGKRGLRYQIYHRAFEIEVSWTSEDREARVETCAYFDKTESLVRKKIVWEDEDVSLLIMIRWSKSTPKIEEALIQLINVEEFKTVKTEVKHFLGF